MKFLYYSTFILLSLLSCADKHDGDVVSEEESTEEEEPVTPSEEIEISSDYEIATWKNFTGAAISHTWDDNTSKQLTVALPLYDSYDFKTTFFTVTNWGPNWSSLKAAFSNGHEIASHSLTHNRFDEITEDQIQNELEDSQIEINTRMNAAACLTFAYSNCVAENFNLTQDYYIAARDCDGQIEAKTPTDFMKISSFLCGDASGNKTAENFNTIAESGLNANGWAVYLFHGIDADGGYSPVDSQELDEHLQFLAVNSDKYWIDTFANVVKYIKERDAVTVNQLSESSELLSVELTDQLDNAVYNYPLTVKKEIPADWKSIEVKQNEIAIDFSVKPIGEKKYVIFEAVPDAGAVAIKKL